MDRLLHDLRSAIRQLRKHVSSTTLAVGTLALGIGSTAAVVSVVDTLILRELPYPDADRIVVVWQNNTRDGPCVGRTTRIRGGPFWGSSSGNRSAMWLLPLEK